MRPRNLIIDELERAYREAWGILADEDRAAQARLNLDFQRDQLQLEALLDLRDLLAQPEEGAQPSESVAEQARSIIAKARSFRSLMR